MYIGKISEQSADLKVSAINRSAANKNEEITGIKKEEIRDVVAISPVGKKQTRIEQLMKQKQNLMELRDSKIANAAESGQNIQKDLDEYEQQLKDIDEQIAKVQTESQDDVKGEDSETGIYENPRTAETAQQEQMIQLTELAASRDKAAMISSVKDKADGEIAVLKSEVKSGYGNIEKKLEDISALETQSEELTGDIANILEETNASLSDMREAVSEDDKAEETNNMDNASNTGNTNINNNNAEPVNAGSIIEDYI